MSQIEREKIMCVIDDYAKNSASYFADKNLFEKNVRLGKIEW